MNDVSNDVEAIIHKDRGYTVDL